MAQQIVIFPSRNGQDWLAEMVGDTDTFDLFGTTVLPTAYGTAMHYSTVMRHLQNRNPLASVDYFATFDEWADEVATDTGPAGRMAIV